MGLNIHAKTKDHKFNGFCTYRIFLSSQSYTTVSLRKKLKFISSCFICLKFIDLFFIFVHKMECSLLQVLIMLTTVKTSTTA